MKERAIAKEETGVVLRRNQNKTTVVNIEIFITHPIYKKRIRRLKKVYAHDESNSTQPGDKVLMVETRPLSKTKRWRIIKILERSKVGSVKEADSLKSIEPKKSNKDNQ